MEDLVEKKRRQGRKHSQEKEELVEADKRHKGHRDEEELVEEDRRHHQRTEAEEEAEEEADVEVEGVTHGRPMHYHNGKPCPVQSWSWKYMAYGYYC